MLVAAVEVIVAVVVVVVAVVVVAVVEPYESGFGYTAPGPKVMLDGE